MCWGNGHSTGTFFFVGYRISNYSGLYLSVYPLDFKFLTNNILITLIIWMDNYYLISKFCFWPSRANSYWTIFKIIKGCFFLNIFYLIISQSRTATRTPIDYSISSINQTIIVHSDKGLVNCLG